MELNQNTGEFISLEEAIAYVTAFRKLHPEQSKGFMAGQSKIMDILSQPDCVGLRIYNGYNDNDRHTNLVILGVNSSERDMTDGLIAEKFGRCPQDCDNSSPLC